MLDRVVDDADVTIITRRDAGDVVVMSLDTWNSWRETLYLMSSPANARRLNESIAQARAGKAQPSGSHRRRRADANRCARGAAKYAVGSRAKKRPRHGRGQKALTWHGS